MNEIRRLLDTPVRGVFGADEGLWDLAHQILVGDYSMGQKKTALRKIDEIIGEAGVVDEASVNKYVQAVLRDEG